MQSLLLLANDAISFAAHHVATNSRALCRGSVVFPDIRERNFNKNIRYEPRHVARVTSKANAVKVAPIDVQAAAEADAVNADCDARSGGLGCGVQGERVWSLTNHSTSLYTFLSDANTKIQPNHVPLRSILSAVRAFAFDVTSTRRFDFSSVFVCYSLFCVTWHRNVFSAFVALGFVQVCA